MIVLVLAGLASSCVQRQAQEVHYFSLTTIGHAGGGQPLASRPDLKLGIGPITIPDSLKKSQIATRSEGNKFSFSEYNRWAGSLDEDLTVVIGENLGLLLEAGSVSSYPWIPPFSPSHRVIVDLRRFDGEFGRDAVLEARWRVAGTKNKEILVEKRSSLRRPAGNSYGQLVEAESALIGDLCREIAREILLLPKEVKSSGGKN